MKHFLLILFCFLTVKNYAQEQKSTVNIIGYYVDFDDELSGMGFSVSYQHSINDYLLAEVFLTHTGGSDFPDNFEYNSLDTSESDAWYTKTSMVNSGINLHLAFVNDKKHYFSVYGGIGCLWLNGTEFLKISIPAFVDGQDTYIVQSTALSEKTSYLSRNVGLRYKYKFSDNFHAGVDINLTQTFKSQNNYILPDNFRAVGIIISKSF